VSPSFTPSIIIAGIAITTAVIIVVVSVTAVVVKWLFGYVNRIVIIHLYAGLVTGSQVNSRFINGACVGPPPHAPGFFIQFYTMITTVQIADGDAVAVTVDTRLINTIDGYGQIALYITADCQLCFTIISKTAQGYKERKKRGNNLFHCCCFIGY
jgi:hypothetical protein